MSWDIKQGDCVEQLQLMGDQSVHCCVTSPPYYGLRDYGTAQWEGGDPVCDHKPKVRPRTSRLKGSLEGSTQTVDESTVQRNCHCGATRQDQQIGLEDMPEQYIERLVGVFREVRRVLRDDATVFLNLGDSYAANRGYQVTDTKHTNVGNNHGATVPTGYKPKDLLMIPARVALALQADGWYLRSDIIWAKPNPMPESVTDRPTSAHEHIFLLAQQEKYYYDADAIAEPALTAGDTRHLRADRTQVAREHKQDGHGRRHAGFNSRYFTGQPQAETRTRRNVWTVATQPLKSAHFATFPPKLIEPCVLAGCPEGGTVLDPFAGAGTTLLVADRLNRHGIGIELNPEYCHLARKRLQDDCPLFHGIESEVVA